MFSYVWKSTILQCDFWIHILKTYIWQNSERQGYIDRVFLIHFQTLSADAVDDPVNIDPLNDTQVAPHVETDKLYVTTEICFASYVLHEHSVWLEFQKSARNDICAT